MDLKQTFFIIGFVALTVLIFNNVSQAITFYGIPLRFEQLNWIAIGALLAAVWYFVFKFKR